MRVSWCRSCGGGHNFGDQLASVLLDYFGIPYTWSPPAHADLVFVGSILSKIPDGWRGTVLGTGIIRAGVRRDLSRANVLAVRGKLTRDACRLPRSTPLGDPGILVPDLTGPTEHHDILVVPHYVDTALAKRHPGYLAPVTTEPVRLAGLIGAAGLLYTSSLHALIAADAFGVPTILEPHGKVIGGLHKFIDYASAMGTKMTPGRPYLSPRSAMVERQAEIRGLLDGYARMHAIE